MRDLKDAAIAPEQYVEGDQKDIINTTMRKADEVDMETEGEEDRQWQEKTKL